MDFALKHAIVRMPNGTLFLQTKGIPMGDPLSPAMTIGACAWMENEWMHTIPQSIKEQFCAQRYMDDIMLLYATNDNWDYESFKADLQRSEVYVNPLTLTDGKPDTFLETRFEVKGNFIRHWLKNENEQGVTIMYGDINILLHIRLTFRKEPY